MIVLVLLGTLRSSHLERLEVRTWNLEFPNFSELLGNNDDDKIIR